jgi:AcrR family transcriptional regulator
MRADAARNRAKLVAAAREAFADAADGSEVTMEAVAKRAGVGIGTLYRHFPTRLELMEAVYREDVDGLRAYADELIASEPPWQALERWFDRFVAFAATKRAIFGELLTAIGKDSELLTYSRGMLNRTVAALVTNAQQAGAVREDVTSSDVLSLLSGCTMMNLGRDQSERVLRVVLDGLRT